MSNNGFPNVNGGFPQVPQQGFPQAQAQGGAHPAGENAPYGFTRQSRGAEQQSGAGAPQGADAGWGAWGNDQWETQAAQGAPQQAAPQGAQALDGNDNTPAASQAG